MIRCRLTSTPAMRRGCCSAYCSESAYWRAPSRNAKCWRASCAQRSRCSSRLANKGKTMIDLHYWTTPNGHKVTIFLEETGLPYRIVPVNISKGEQFRPEFLAISPNNRIPGIVDHDPKERGAPISVFESGAILLYLAEKTGQYLPSGLRDRVAVMEWLFWQ